MTDEKYLFVSDSKDKKRVARGAYNKKSHGGRVKMPSDYLTRKEREAMSGECKSYRLNEPMSWDEFRTMPDDIQKSYVLALREKFKVSDSKIFDMMGVNQRKGSYHFKEKLGIGLGRNAKFTGFDYDGWVKWCAGIKDNNPVEKMHESFERMAEASATVEIEKVAEAIKTAAALPTEKKRLSPLSGHVTLRGTPAEIAETIASFLGSECIMCEVKWEVV